MSSPTSNALQLETTDNTRALQFLVELVNSQSDHVYIKKSAHFFYLPLELAPYAQLAAKRLNLQTGRPCFRQEFHDDEPPTPLAAAFQLGVRAAELGHTRIVPILPPELARAWETGFDITFRNLQHC